MAAPTTLLTPGTVATITATGEANGLLVKCNQKTPNPVLTLGFAGTFTSVVLAIRGRIIGGTNFYPIPVLKQTDNTVPSNSASITLTNSTNVSFQMSTDGYDEVEVYAVSGTLTDFQVEGNITSGNGASPVTVAVNTGTAGTFTNITASGTLDVTGATTLGSTLDVTGLATFDGGSLYPDDATLALGTGSDITFLWNGTKAVIGAAAANSAIDLGEAGAGIDWRFFGDTSGADVLWDQSADSLIFYSTARLVFSGTTGQSEIHLTDNLADALSIEISGSTDLLTFTTTDDAESVSPIGLRCRQATAVAITGATTLKLSDSGGIFTVSQGAAYDIDLPSPTSGAGCTYYFQLVSPGANNVTITVAGAAATFEGVIVNDVTSVVPATGSTLTFASGVSALGDCIEVRSLATNKYHVRAISSANGGITVS